MYTVFNSTRRDVFLIDALDLSCEQVSNAMIALERDWGEYDQIDVLPWDKNTIDFWTYDPDRDEWV
jgi:hypothetical protein